MKGRVIGRMTTAGDEYVRHSVFVCLQGRSDMEIRSVCQVYSAWTGRRIISKTGIIHG